MEHTKKCMNGEEWCMCGEKSAKIKVGIVLVKEEKRKMEKEIGNILKAFELNTGLKPGIVFHEKSVVFPEDLDSDPDYEYRVNIPVHL